MSISRIRDKSCILLMCPTQVHFRLLTCSIMAVTFVCFSVPIHLYVMFNILRSIFVCAAAILFFAQLVSAHVTVPYVIAGSMHEL